MHTFPFKLCNYVSFLFVQKTFPDNPKCLQAWCQNPNFLTVMMSRWGSWGSQTDCPTWMVRLETPPRSSSCKDQNGWDVLNQTNPENFLGVWSKNWVVVSNIFYVHPYLGQIPILPTIFQLGWNHQLLTLHWTPENHRKTIWTKPWLWNPMSLIKSREKCELGQV